MKHPRVWLVMWLPLDAPVPRGWKLARCRRSHHDRWAKLVRRVIVR